MINRSRAIWTRKNASTLGRSGTVIRTHPRCTQVLLLAALLTVPGRSFTSWPQTPMQHFFAAHLPFYICHCFTYYLQQQTTTPSLLSRLGIFSFPFKAELPSFIRFSVCWLFLVPAFDGCFSKGGNVLTSFSWVIYFL